MIYSGIFKAAPKCLWSPQLILPNTTVGYIDFKPLRKESSLSMSKQFQSSNVQSVIIRLLEKVTLLLIRDLYIWAISSHQTW
jgi:hypothetical protein